MGRQSLIWPKRWCPAKQGTPSGVLRRKQHRLFSFTTGEKNLLYRCNNSFFCVCPIKLTSVKPAFWRELAKLFHFVLSKGRLDYKPAGRSCDQTVAKFLLITPIRLIGRGIWGLSRLESPQILPSSTSREAAANSFLVIFVTRTAGAGCDGNGEKRKAASFPSHPGRQYEVIQFLLAFTLLSEVCTSWRLTHYFRVLWLRRQPICFSSSRKVLIWSHLCRESTTEI